MNNSSISFIVKMNNEFYLPTEIWELIFLKINSDYGRLHLKFASKKLV